MQIKQTRIFAPSPWEENWYQNLLGRIIKPLTSKYRQQLEWFWFTQYSGGLDSTRNEDCDVQHVVDNYVANGDTRSIRFRFCVADNKLEAELKELLDSNGYFITDVRDWDMVGDVGSGRHIGGEITIERQNQRAERLVRFYHQTAMLVLDVLEEKAPNSFGWEQNTHHELDQVGHSSFVVPHHIFCNSTTLQLPVRIMTEIVDKPGKYHGWTKLMCTSNWGMTSWYLLKPEVDLKKLDETAVISF